MPIENPSVIVTCIGSGDAFGSGGRLQSCYHIHAINQQFLLDCGGSALIGLQRCGLSAADIDTVIISHLHGDHFGGIPYLMLDGKYGSKRSKLLTLIGPPGLQQAVEQLASVLYPGTFDNPLDFKVKYIELAEMRSVTGSAYQLQPLRVRHGHSEHVYGIRLQVADRLIAYSGDTEWNDNLPLLATGSDLFIAECCGYDQPLPSHLDYRTLLDRRAELECRRLVLTHMGPEVLKHLDTLELEYLNDGDVLYI